MEPVHPLRISKTGSNPFLTSPDSAKANKPLTEIGITSQRRNSPSFNATSKRTTNSFDANGSISSLNKPISKTSIRDFWSSKESTTFGRFDENTPERSPSPSVTSPKRRPSVERLMQASRVKNSNMFALENKDVYDPTSTPVVERPSANRPLSDNIIQNNFAILDSLNKENKPLQSPARNRNSDADDVKEGPTPSRIALPASPEKRASPSPTKSSLARNSQFGSERSELYDPFSSAVIPVEPLYNQPRILRRHAKSVTFHEEPPEINEYEQQTPEPSLSVTSDREGSWDSDEYYEQDNSYERDSSSEHHFDDSFDEDLENADKTPVVLPEDWSRMSPSEARTDLVDENDNVFDNVDEETQRVEVPRPDSRAASDGETRPLPPIPSLQSKLPLDTPSTSIKGALFTKADILNGARASPLTAHDRLSMLTSPKAKTIEDQLDNSEIVTFTNLDTGKKADVDTAQTTEAKVLHDVAELASPPRISRESILRKVRNTKYDFDDEDDGEHESDVVVDQQLPDMTRPSLAELAMMHPDEPIPSRENSHEKSEIKFDHLATQHVDDDSEPQIKHEYGENEEIDLHAIPDCTEADEDDDWTRQGSVLHHSIRYDSVDDESHYSDSLVPDGESTPTALQSRSVGLEDEEGREALHDAMQLLTVKDYGEPIERTTSTDSGAAVHQMPSFLDNDDFSTDFADFLGSESKTDDRSLPAQYPAKPEVVERSILDDIPYLAPPASSNDSVYRAQQFDAGETHEISDLYVSEMQLPELQEIPERKATIKTGGRLKARPSGSAADFAFMTTEQHSVEAEHPVPTIPDAYRTEIEQTRDSSRCSSGSDKSKADSLVDNSTLSKRESVIVLDLNLPTSRESESDGLGLAAELDRVIEGQKRGYVMREAAKVVVASNRNVSASSDGTAKSGDGLAKTNSERRRHEAFERKVSAEQYLKTEPWNGATRRKSIRNAAVSADTSVPPMPNMQRSPLDALAEASSGQLPYDVDHDVERGRLFVKVVGIRDLDIPLPRNDRLYFQLTLDNGLHCVTTADIELDKRAPIGQEFELVVLNDLEFQLTLTTQLPTPPTVPAAASMSAMSSPSKASRTPKSGFSRFLSSPKKRAEKERQEREAAEAEERRMQDEMRRKRASLRPTAWDLLHDLVNAADGSFARAYINLASHERECFGRPLTVSVPCYNEWALEKDQAIMASVRSKRGANNGPVRRPPYVVGHLELQLLYIPKPATATDEDMPKSMNAAIREMNKASEVKVVSHEGFLSQQGGDCVHWRRRFFRLQGPRLTAYHEHTNQKRAVINLTKASRLIDDRSTLVADPKSSNPKGKNRRKSAFSEEDEGYQYVEEGFRLRFANGETIDFYADSRALKDEWMEALSQVIGKPDVDTKTASWTDLVLAREQADRKAYGQVEATSTEITDTRESIGHVAATASIIGSGSSKRATERKPAPATAASHRTSQDLPMAPPPRSRTPPLSARTEVRSRTAVKSMIF